MLGIKELSNTYKISYYVVLAYFPVITEYKSNFDNTILPDKIECVPRKYAIFYRNKWMIKKSDYVVTYISKQIGSGAAKFKEISIKQGKKVIELFNKS